MFGQKKKINTELSRHLGGKIETQQLYPYSSNWNIRYSYQQIHKEKHSRHTESLFSITKSQVYIVIYISFKTREGNGKDIIFLSGEEHVA